MSNIRQPARQRAVQWTVLALLVLMLPADTLACGLPLNARIPSEQALISFAEGRQELITSVQLQSAGPQAAVIFPVPGRPEVDVPAGDSLFRYLEQVTRPQVRIEERIIWRPEELAAGGAAAPVNVLGRDVIGGYDVARLASSDAGALQSWLDQNGYLVPAGAQPILQEYINESWSFVAVKLAPGQATNGALKPLRISFDTQEIVYPMRLGRLADGPLDVLLYIVADRRMDIPGMETQYAGPVAQLDPRPAPDIGPLLRGAFLTKLRNQQVMPASLTADFVARPAATNEPFRQVRTQIVFVDGWQRFRKPILFIVGLLVGNLLLIIVALFLRRRLLTIAGLDSRKQHD